MKKTLAAITAFFNKNEDLIENYALIGGLAIGGWVAPRATRDIDFFISLKKDKQPAREGRGESLPSLKFTKLDERLFLCRTDEDRQTNSSK